MMFRQYALSLLVGVSLFSASAVFAQPTPPQPAGGSDQATESKGEAKDNVEVRIKRQRERIRAALQAGTMNRQQAAKLRGTLDDLATQVNGQRQQNGGTLKPDQLKAAESTLNSNNKLIQSLTGAASKPGSLLKQMKQEEKKEVGQYRQAMQQKLEQQQLDYEKRMTGTLADSKKTIAKQKQQVKEIRKETAGGN